MNTTINEVVMRANEAILGEVWEMYDMDISKAYISGTTLLCCDPRWLAREFGSYDIKFDPKFDISITDLTDDEEFAIWLVKSDDERFDLEIIIDTADSRYYLDEDDDFEE